MLLACQVQRPSMAKMPLEGKQAQKGALKRHRVVYNRSKDTTPMLIKTQSRMHACRMKQKSLFLFCPPFFLPSKKKREKKRNPCSIHLLMPKPYRPYHTHTHASLYDCNNAQENKQSQETPFVPKWYREAAKYLTAPQ